MSNETIYTSFDLMKIFGIKKGSWYNIKNKFDLDLYSEQILDGKQVKFVYNQQAYEILKNNYRREYSSRKDTIDKMDSICMILSIEVSNNNDDDIYFIFDNCITSLFDDNICKKFDMIFFHPLFIKTKMFKELNNGFETPVNLKFPVILTKDVGFTQTKTNNKKKKNKKKPQAKAAPAKK